MALLIKPVIMSSYFKSVTKSTLLILLISLLFIACNKTVNPNVDIKKTQTLISAWLEKKYSTNSRQGERSFIDSIRTQINWSALSIVSLDQSSYKVFVPILNSLGLIVSIDKEINRVTTGMLLKTSANVNSTFISSALSHPNNTTTGILSVFSIENKFLVEFSF